MNGQNQHYKQENSSSIEHNN